MKNRVIGLSLIVTFSLSLLFGYIYFTSGKTLVTKTAANIKQENPQSKKISTETVSAAKVKPPAKSGSKAAAETPENGSNVPSGSTGSTTTATTSSSNENSTAAGSPSEPTVIETINTTLKINTGSNQYSHSVTVAEGASAYDQLEEASKKYGFSIDVKNYSYGVFVEKIHGVRNNPPESMYWMLYINGKISSTGASSLILKEGDVILWKYQKTN